MLGTINKQRQLDKLLSETSEIVEVYADVNFSFEQDSVILYVFSHLDFDTPKFLFGLQKIFPVESKFYFTHRNLDSMLQGNKIIWRKGKWYV